MHGESCISVLIDGTPQNVNDGLAYELKENFKCDNIFKISSKLLPKMHFLQCYLTEYDQSVFKIKVKDDGVEHKWGTLPDNLIG